VFFRRRRIKKEVTRDGTVVYTTPGGRKLVSGTMSPITEQQDRQRVIEKVYAGFWRRLWLRFRDR